jgi:hypothetical protein
MPTLPFVLSLQSITSPVLQDASKLELNTTLVQVSLVPVCSAQIPYISEAAEKRRNVKSVTASGSC